jgi:hypothetical protein
MLPFEGEKLVCNSWYGLIFLRKLPEKESTHRSKNEVSSADLMPTSRISILNEV